MKVKSSLLLNEGIEVPNSPGSNISQKFSTPFRNKDTSNENVFSSPINVKPIADRLLCGRALRTPSRY